MTEINQVNLSKDNYKVMNELLNEEVKKVVETSPNQSITLQIKIKPVSANSTDEMPIAVEIEKISPSDNEETTTKRMIKTIVENCEERIKSLEELYELLLASKEERIVEQQKEIDSLREKIQQTFDSLPFNFTTNADNNAGDK